MKSRILVLFALLLLCRPSFAADATVPSRTEKVVVEFVVGPDGRPKSIRVIEASDKKVADQAVAAVSKWQLDKKYAGRKMRQPFTFVVDDVGSEQKADQQK